LHVNFINDLLEAIEELTKLDHYGKGSSSKSQTISARQTSIGNERNLALEGVLKEPKKFINYWVFTLMEDALDQLIVFVIGWLLLKHD